ncbi:alpha-galactosidase [Ereboglobus luteus]|uniref:Alpha-galactosidase n=2 Tax=Ereboglobus luteus TaxID=1796921 RepID=A0A2U8E6A7_9BACT|nr:alpha-galactosidase [Ereboglobus luteus]
MFLGACLPAQESAITVGPSGKSWSIQTRSAVYHLAVSGKGPVNVLYFGNRLQRMDKVKMQGQEVPVRGGNVFEMPMLEVVFADGVRDIELEYKDHEILSMDGYPVLKIVQRDKHYPLEVASYIRVLPEYDVIEKWVEAINTGSKDNIRVENMLSGSVFLPKDVYELTHYSGAWGHELVPHTTKLTQGIKTLQVKAFKSHGASSFMVRPEGETGMNDGRVWFGTLCYSGNWRVDFEKFFPGLVQIAGGINFWDQEINLRPGQTFATPKMLFGYTEQGANGATASMASYIREKTLPAPLREKIRPVLYNSWYATTFDINEDQQLALAKVAAELGVEMFVIDDGWFKGRKNANAGLGDWTVDKEKFPNGLSPMIEKINAMGLDFGIWIEPEMVNPDSDLYRAHPDWVFHFPNRELHRTKRPQCMLNLAREDVYQYLHKSIHDLLKNHNIKYVKWDANKTLSDPGFPSAPAGEQRAVRVRYVENLYRLVETLRSEFPDVWFENCSSGGGRLDLGMMARFDCTWPSDISDPVDRIFMHDSYLALFPANTMVSWVSEKDWHRRSLPLEYKFDVSMAGVLGIGCDIAKWSGGQRKIAREKIAQYKKIRNIVQQGDVSRLVSPHDENRNVLQYTDRTKRAALVFVYNLAEYPGNTVPDKQRSPLVRLCNLLPDATYRIKGVKGNFKGSYLMEIGMDFPVKGAYRSGIFEISMIELAAP